MKSGKKTPDPPSVEFAGSSRRWSWERETVSESMKKFQPSQVKRGAYPQRRKKSGAGRSGKIKPSADSRLKPVFAKIGVPDAKAFTPDAFQRKALAAVADSDCLVSAPTGSGKTWIAQEAIRRIHDKGGKAWYASPLKALTNSKLVEFGSVFGRTQVGILTGDRKENADAPIIVGTTEILRNQLYDAMHQGTDLTTDLVILDEAHFLGDPDRGVVWEEVMIYLPQRIHLLLLSATIGNAFQIAGWLESIRSKRCVVVEEKARPVPLFPLFFQPSGRLLPLLSGDKLDKKVKRFVNSAEPQLIAPPGQLPPFADILEVLKRYDLLPAIFFMKSRADCDAALNRCIGGGRTSGRNKLNRAIDELVGGSVYLEDHRQMWHLRNMAVAAHHSGQLPAWKLLIEALMTDGWLQAVFATSTVAAGVNFPARSVVFLNSDRYNGHQFVPLNGTEFHQMTGRAGRRGKDRIGFAVILPSKYMDVRLMADLCISQPEDVKSQIRTDFSMVLNLLLSHSPDEIEEIFRRSFATYIEVVNREPGLEERCQAAGRQLMSFLPKALCGRPENVLGWIRKRKALIWEIKDLHRRLKGRKELISKMACLEPGRLFLDRRGRMYCVVKKQAGAGGESVLAVRAKKKPSFGHQRLRLRRFSPKKVGQILDRVVPLPDISDAQKVREAIARAAGRRPRALSADRLQNGAKVAGLEVLQAELASRQAQLDALICTECAHRKLCHGRAGGAFREALETFSMLWDQMDAVRARLWNDFLRHLKFLTAEGFAYEDGRLTSDGHWASRLRLDQPLLVAEALRQGVLPEADPVLLAALVAPFAYDREVETAVDESKLSPILLEAYARMRAKLEGIAKRKEAGGFEVRPISLWASASVYAWAGGRTWEEVVALAGSSEGDLAMLVLRTAENLRQIAGLGKAFPLISESASAAIDLILKEPVVWE